MFQLTPELWVFAGPNGVGKSTLVDIRLRQRLPIVNPDVIAARISRDHPETPANIEAGKIAVRERAALLAARESFAMETTLSGNSEIRVMRQARDEGYKVNLVFVGVRSPSISEFRVAHRVRLGQHDVPAEDIRRRYFRSMANLPVAMGLAHRSVVVDNTGRGFRLLLIRRGGVSRLYGRKLPSWAIEAIPPELR